MGKTIIIASPDCMPCMRLVTLLECQGLLDDYELLELGDADDMEKLADILEKNPELVEEKSPQCVDQKDDGTYGPCDIEKVWDVAEAVLKERAAAAEGNSS